MYRCKKIITAFVLLLILAVPLFFSVLVMVEQQVTQYERNERFSEEVLQTITASSVAVYWLEPGKEILINGKLFDVKSFVIKDNSISLTGFFDCKEDELVQQMEKLELQKNHSGSPFNQPAIKFLFFAAYNINQQEINCNEGCWKFVSQQYHQFDEMIPTGPCRLPMHPPC
jgi:hypothetical protein